MLAGAVIFKINENCTAKIYLSGNYGKINWDEDFASNLGENCRWFNYKSDISCNDGLIIAKGVNQEYILRLTETKRYILRLEGEDSKNIIPHIQNEGNKSLKCDHDENSLTFQFVNYLGRSKFVFDGTDAKKTISFEVVPNKINFEDDYIALTNEIAKVCSELLMEYSGSTSNAFGIGESKSRTVFEQFIFLRQFCYDENVLGLFESIKRNPDRSLIRYEEMKPYGNWMPSAKFFSRPFSYGKNWAKVKASDGEKYLPEEVAVTRKYESFDTPANRFIKFAISSFDDICTQILQMKSDDKYMQQTECLQEAESLHVMMQSILHDRFFDDVGTLEMIPQNSTVLQKREGYSQIFQAYSKSTMALKLDWTGMDDIYEGESKNVALLYEYWLFFELYRILKSIDGCEPNVCKEMPFAIGNEDKFTISLKQGMQSCQSFVNRKFGMKINLYYNRIFERKDFEATRYEGSYSHKFRPDYTIALYPAEYDTGKHNGEEEAIKHGDVSFIHFDAKYRLNDLTAFINNEDKAPSSDEEDIEDRLDTDFSKYKSADLYKMHTYNDAIRRTVGSYVLYPGSDGKSLSKGYHYSMYDEILPGVGAFAIKPSNRKDGEKQLVDFITKAMEEKAQNFSRLSRLEYYADMVIREPSIKKSGYFGGMLDDAENLNLPKPDENIVLGYIRAELKSDYYQFLLDNDLLKNGGEFLFYFYAIKGEYVYSHHRDIPSAKYFCFYRNDISRTGTYELEPVLCEITSNELLSKKDLTARLADLGYRTDADRHHADFYYVLTVKVIDDDFDLKPASVSEVNAENGNDTFSPHSPKIVSFKEIAVSDAYT